MIFGYCRVSTFEQNLEGQVEELRAAGCDKIFSEKISGSKTANRPQLAALLKAMQRGDVLVVTRLDRLARSTLDLLSIVAALGELGATFRSTKDTWANTDTPHGRLMLTVLGGLAEFERSLILMRTAEGRARAVSKGVRMGAKPKLTLHQQAEARLRLATESPGEVAKAYNVSTWTIRRLVKNRLPTHGTPQ
jgi:DNA invertase Pin-like site-specific DNA recombinase